jgi:V8-like Glu-specific endopeptidase
VATADRGWACVWRKALAGAVLGLVAWAAQANIFVTDRRQQSDASLPPLRSVGLLHHAVAGVGGTAFLIGACHALTAHHVAFPQDLAAAAGRAGGGRASKAQFLVGADPARPGQFASRSRVWVVAKGRFSDADYAGMAGDWALLKLEVCLGRQYGFLKLGRVAADSPMPTGALMVAGYPRSRAHLPGITVERGCRARDHGPVNGLVGIDCAFESGMSGAPVLEHQRGRGWQVVGMVQQTLGSVDGILPDYSMLHRNQMLSVSAFRKEVEDALRAEARRVLPPPGAR